MFIQDMYGTPTLFIFPREIEDVHYILLDRISCFAAPRRRIPYDAARAVYMYEIPDEEKDRVVWLLKAAKKAFATTPEEAQLDWSRQWGRFRMTMPFRYYEHDVDEVIKFLENN